MEDPVQNWGNGDPTEKAAKNAPKVESVYTSDRNSRTGNENREIWAGSKISRPDREKAGNGEAMFIIHVYAQNINT